MGTMTAAADRRMIEADVRKGSWVRVVRGRKVPVGTEGWCIWMGESDYGTRVGVKDRAGVVHWTACANVAVYPAPADMQAAADAERQEYLARRAALPVCQATKGGRVRVVRGKLASGGVAPEGKVFWVGPGRDGAPRYGVDLGVFGKQFVSGRDCELVAGAPAPSRRRHARTVCPTCARPSTLGMQCGACEAEQAARDESDGI